MRLQRYVWAGALVCGACGGYGGGRDEATIDLTLVLTPGTTDETSGGTPTSGEGPTGSEGEATGDTSTTSGGSTSGTTGTSADTGASETTGECAAQMLTPEVMQVPVDIIVMIDTSDSMANAIAAVEASINVDFAQILTNSMIDYRIIVIGDYPPPEAQLTICISMPLSGAADCDNPPAVPAITERYKHYDRLTGSGAFLDNFLTWYVAADPHGLAPGGFRDFLRDGARKVILAMTDGTSASGDAGLGDAFDMSLLMLDPPLFGTPGDRDYVFHTVISMAPNDPADAPWLPPDPIQGEGGSIQQVSVLSGGWRFPLSQTQDFDVLFQEIAKAVVEETPIACEFPVPIPDMGMIDPNTVEIDYTPGDGGPLQSYHQVTGPDVCEEDAFYIFAGSVYLCPQACAEVQADAMAQLDVRYGCDVGFIPG